LFKSDRLQGGTMESWEFLIQREGDRGWRPIKTGSLQLMEGRYRILANSQLPDTPIETQITHQTMGEGTPKRRSQTRKHVTNKRGMLVIIPFTNLKSGIWQFVCSETDTNLSPQPKILQVKVLPNSQAIASVTSNSPTENTADVDVPPPTEPLVPLPNFDEPEHWDGTLDRLLAQIEQDSLQPRQPEPKIAPAQRLLISPVILPPLRLIKLERSVFVQMCPGDRLILSGACNLKLITDRRIQDGIVDKLSICLRDTQTGKIVTEIDQKVPPYVDRFAFNGELQLPIILKTNLLIGEINLYDLDRIPVGSCGFTVALTIDPLPEFDLSFLELLERDLNSLLEPAQGVASAVPNGRLTPTAEAALFPQDLPQQKENPSAQLPTTELARSFEQPDIPELTRNNASTESTIGTALYPTVPMAYRRESLFAQHPDILAVTPSIDRIQSPYPTREIEPELEWEDRYARNCDSMEVVIDD
jgi:hypothetical protein